MQSRSGTERRLTCILLAVLAAGSCSAPEPDAPVNFLLITADDLEWSSVGVYGSEVDDITPSIDRLASEGLRFTNAHVNIAICQPSRQSMMTGRYPHNIGAPGFQPISDDVPLLQESLRNAGYLNGSIGKTRHLQPVERFGWDLGPDADNPGEGIWMHHLGNGRDIDLYREYMTEFLQLARNEDQPFWLMLNTHDPHKPFYGDGGDEFDYPVSRVYSPEEIVVPGYLPDLPDVREELARYYTSVRRADDIVGAILTILEDEGFLDNTLVMFISDNGSSFPFSKANAYLNSTKTPWVIRWPGNVEPGTVDTSHFISGIDYMPTVLEVAGLAPVSNLDGTSFLPLLEGGEQPWRTSVFTEMNTPFSGISLHMRAIQNEDFGYIYNPFFGTEIVDIEGNDGPSWDAMVEAARSDASIQERVDLFSNRVPEELYHYKTDPDALNNLVADPAYADVLADLRQQLANEMARTDDFMLERFERQYGIEGLHQ